MEVVYIDYWFRVKIKICCVMKKDVNLIFFLKRQSSRNKKEIIFVEKLSIQILKILVDNYF